MPSPSIYRELSPKLSQRWWRNAIIAIAVILGEGIYWVPFVVGDGLGRPIVVVSSLSLWVMMPVGVTHYFRVQNPDGIEPSNDKMLRRTTLAGIVVGLMFSNFHATSTASSLYGFVTWQLAAGSFSLSAVCLALTKGRPLPFKYSE